MPIDDDLRRDLARHVATLNRALVGLVRMVAAKEPHRKTDPAYIAAVEAAKAFDGYVEKAEQ
jgi:hypothetical protein